MDLKAEVERLLTVVPRAAGEELPSGTTAGAIEGLADRTGLPVPAALREWLMVTNGPCIGPGGLFGILPSRPALDIEGHYELFPAWKRNGWIPVAGDGSGNYYVLSAQPGQGLRQAVYFIDTHEDPEQLTYVVASNLWMFLRFLLGREAGEVGWPFDPKVVLVADPDLESVRGVPLPWDA